MRVWRRRSGSKESESAFPTQIFAHVMKSCDRKAGYWHARAEQDAPPTGLLGGSKQGQSNPAPRFYLCTLSVNAFLPVSDEWSEIIPEGIRNF